MTRTIAALLLTAALPMPAAALTLVGSWSSDAAFEGPNGFVQQAYGATTTLPQLERAVGEVRLGRTGDRTAGFHVPTSATGIPGVGAGVTQALTNVAPLGPQRTTAWTSGQPVAFSLSRVGTTLTYTVGSDSWSSTASYFGGINAFTMRVRSAPERGLNSLSLTNLIYSSGGSNQALADFSAANGATAIRLYGGIAGAFTLSGNATLSWDATNRPGASALASQIKLLEVPTSPIPEPGTWAMMIVGFGAVGAAMRRRRTGPALAAA